MARFHHVLTESADGVKTISMNRPDKRNALCPLLMEELTEVLNEAGECDCGVVILTGTGPAFCSGLDMEHLETMNASTPEEHRRDSERLAQVLRTLYDFPKPIIAAVNGPAIAGGMALATIPDFTLAAPEARFGYTEVRVGFVPAIVATFLIRQVGELPRTRELLCSSGRILKAHEALQLGLVTQIVDQSDLMALSPRTGPDAAPQQPAGHAGGEVPAVKTCEAAAGRGDRGRYQGECIAAVRGGL